MQTHILKSEISIAPLIGFRCKKCNITSTVINCPRCGALCVAVFDSKTAMTNLQKYMDFFINGQLLIAKKIEFETYFHSISNGICETAATLLKATFFKKILPELIDEIKKCQISFPNLKNPLQNFRDMINSLNSTYIDKDIVLRHFELLFTNYKHQPSQKLLSEIDQQICLFFQNLPFFEDTFQKYIVEMNTDNIFIAPLATLRKHEFLAIISIIQNYFPKIQSNNYFQKYLPLEVF